MITVAVLIAAGTAVLSRFSGPLAWLAAAVATAGTAVLLPMVLKKVQQSDPDKEVLSRETTLWCPVAKATDPVRLGVHPALDVDERRPPRVPAYIRRDIDDDLATALRGERLIVLIGESTAGKSRVAFEAIHRELPEHHLLVPRSAGSLRRLADAGCVLRKTVVLLDDLDRYLGPEGIDLALLDRLAGPDGDLVTLATMRTGAYARYTTGGAPTVPEDDMRAVRGLLDCARILRLERRNWSAAELARARELARTDPSIRQALAATRDGVGLAEFLAAAPRLWDRWRDGRAIDVQPAGAAIVSAAVDCRRAGLAGSVPEEVLRELYQLYLDEATVALLGPDAFEAGIAWATMPIHATSALLARVDGGYRVFDYLVDRVEHDPDHPGVPQPVWDVLVRLLPAGEVWLVGITAYYLRLYEVSRRAFERSADVGPPVTALSRHGLGLLAWRDNRLDEAETQIRQALQVVDGGLARATVENSLGHLLAGQGAVEEAAELLTRAANFGYLPAVTALGRLRLEQGDHAGAEDAFRRAAAAGSAYGSVFLGYLLAQRGDIRGAESAYRRAHERGSVEGAARLGKLLLHSGNAADAVQYLRAAAGAGDTDAANDLGKALEDLGQIGEAKRWLQYGADRGDAAAAYNLGRLLQQQGEDEQAEIYLRQSAKSGGLVAAINLADLLITRGEFTEARYWLRSVIDAPDEALAAHEAEVGVQGIGLRLMAILNLGYALARMGDLGGALEWFERAAATGHPDAIAQLRRYRRFLDEGAVDRAREGPDGAVDQAAIAVMTGRFGEAEPVLRPLAEAGDERARYWLAVSCASRGADAEAAEILETLVHTESLTVGLAAAELAVNVARADLARRVLSRYDATETAKAAYDMATLLKVLHPDQDADWFIRRAADGGHPAAMTERGVRLYAQGQQKEAEAILRKAAKAGDHGAEYNLGHILSHTGRRAEAEGWYRRAAASGHVFAQVNLALLLIREGRLSEAEPLLLRAAAAGDHDAEYNLGVLYQLVGRKADATTWLNRAAAAGHQGARMVLGDSSH
jgi:TPR repeat protein